MFFEGSDSGSSCDRESSQISHELKNDGQNDNTTEVSVPDAGSVSASSNDGKRVSHRDIEFVQNLIERCLQLYMHRDEVVKTLSTRAKIDPGFTTLVWQKLEEENADFFRAYNIRLLLKKQILLFNHLLEHQYLLRKYSFPPKVPPVPIRNGIHPIPVNNLPMGYPVYQRPQIPIHGQPHHLSMGSGISSCHVVNGIPAPSNFHHIRMNSENGMVMDNSSDMEAGIPPNARMPSKSEMPMSPLSGESSGHFPFTASEMSGIGVENSEFDAPFSSDVTSSRDLQFGADSAPGHPRDSHRALEQIQWDFSLSDLAADLSNLGDFGALENYTNSPFHPSEREILLEFPEPEDIVEDFFADSVPEQQGSQSDEEKSQDKRELI